VPLADKGRYWILTPIHQLDERREQQFDIERGLSFPDGLAVPDQSCESVKSRPISGIAVLLEKLRKAIH